MESFPHLEPAQSVHQSRPHTPDLTSSIAEISQAHSSINLESTYDEVQASIAKLLQWHDARVESGIHDADEQVIFESLRESLGPPSLDDIFNSSDSESNLYSSYRGGGEGDDSGYYSGESYGDDGSEASHDAENSDADSESDSDIAMTDAEIEDYSTSDWYFEHTELLSDESSESALDDDDDDDEMKIDIYDDENDALSHTSDFVPSIPQNYATETNPLYSWDAFTPLEKICKFLSLPKTWDATTVFDKMMQSPRLWKALNSGRVPIVGYCRCKPCAKDDQDEEDFRSCHDHDPDNIKCRPRLWLVRDPIPFLEDWDMIEWRNIEDRKDAIYVGERKWDLGGSYRWEQMV